MRSTRNVALSVLLFCASVGAWEGLVRLFQVPAFILPPPSQVALALWRGFSSGLYLEHLSHTLLETMLGFIAGSALGLILGTAVAMSRPVESIGATLISMPFSARSSCQGTILA